MTKHFEHVFYYRDDELSHCKICNGAEGSLPSHCPGVRMTDNTEEAVYAGLIDYNEGSWVPGHIQQFAALVSIRYVVCDEKILGHITDPSEFKLRVLADKRANPKPNEDVPFVIGHTPLRKALVLDFMRFGVPVPADYCLG